MLHQKLARQKQALLLVFGQSTVPALQRCGLINIGRNLLLVELINELLINENIRAPGAMLEVFYILDQALIMSIKIQRSEEHTSELQSRGHLVCRLLLEKKKKDSP